MAVQGGGHGNDKPHVHVTHLPGHPKAPAAEAHIEGSPRDLPWGTEFCKESASKQDKDEEEVVGKVIGTSQALPQTTQVKKNENPQTRIQAGVLRGRPSSWLENYQKVHNSPLTALPPQPHAAGKAPHIGIVSGGNAEHFGEGLS